MIASIVVGRGTNRTVIERPRDFAASQQLARALIKGLGIAPADPAKVKYVKPKGRRAA